MKKIVNSRCPEFGYELLSSLPYAYNLYLKGELEETISAYDTSCLYFFSPKHTETNIKRSWDNMNILWKEKFPNINIHRKELDWEHFSPPPLKEFYKERAIKFEKETIVIFNRYNKEWNEPPINFLSIETLDRLFNLLSEKYQIIYINLNKGDEYFDGAKPMELNDDLVLKNYPKVYSLYDVMDKFPKLTINELQLRIFANCTKYISSNGGQLILSAYFGGENIIFSKKCREIDPKVNSFFKWYHKLGGGVFQHVNTYDDLIQLVEEKWVLKKPLINILVRTSGRPRYFNKCMESIYNQKYKNWNIIVGIDDIKSTEYTQTHKCIEVMYDYSKVLIPKPPNNVDFGIPFKYNLYLNDLQNKVNDGYVIYLDDDDSLYDSNSLLKLANSIKSNDDFVMWRVKFPNRLVPSENNFGKSPVLKDVSGIGYSFHIKNKEMWEPYKRGDYRVAKKIYDKISNKIFLNEIITKLQREVEDGMGTKDDLPIKIKKLSIIIPTYKNVQFLPECFDSILKSIKDLDCEILVGIDGCQDTVDYIKKNTFDNRFKFYFFEKNVGPYVIKNTLANISSSDKLLFFDSDDIMLENIITDTLSILDNHNIYRPMYLDFVNDTAPKSTTNIKTNHFGYGVFGIKKDFFISLNGFNGWRCEADSDFHNRLRLNNTITSIGKTVSFLRRIHTNSLTTSPETNYTSKLRAHYRNLTNKNNKPVCEKFETSNYTIVNVTELKEQRKIILEQKNNIKKLLTSIIGDTTIKTEIDYGKINEVISKNNSYDVKSSIKPIRENLPKDRNELLEKKKNSNTDQISKILPVKPNRRNNSPNIFGTRKKI
jgi:glycosyltransferase involved in cell wall biosynthesis